jgi:hypothetical protein
MDTSLYSECATGKSCGSANAWKRLCRAAFLVFLGHAALACPRLGPEEKREALLAQADEAYAFIVRGDAPTLQRAVTAHVQGGDPVTPTPLPSVAGVAVRLRVRDAQALCTSQGLVQLWYLHPALADAYVKVMAGIDYAYRTLEPPSVLNLSLGPPVDAMPLPMHDNEPMHEATRVAADKGLMPVFAIGNIGADGESPGSNPWCAPAWVICVGAASADGSSLWDRSVRGNPTDRRTWPDVVAYGINVVSLWPSNLEKSEERRRRDQATPEFLARVRPEDRALYTVESGTSQAVPHVSRAAAQIILFVRSLAEEKGSQPRDKLFSLTMPETRWENIGRLQQRLAGEVVHRASGEVEVAYRLVEPWKLVKQLLIDTSRPVTGHALFEAGAGFVDPRFVEAQFGHYGVVDPRIFPVQVR